jgi:hypothetical protein
MPRKVLAYDVALVVWTIVWLVAGVLVYRDVNELVGLSEPVVDAAAALEETAQGLRQIDEIPFIGEVANLPAIERDVRIAAVSARRSAREAEDNVERLAYLLAAAVAFVPTVPPLALWLSVRRDWSRRT